MQSLTSNSVIVTCHILKYYNEIIVIIPNHDDITKNIKFISSESAKITWPDIAEAEGFRIRACCHLGISKSHCIVSSNPHPRGILKISRWVMPVLRNSRIPWPRARKYQRILPSEHPGKCIKEHTRYGYPILIDSSLIPLLRREDTLTRF